MSSSSSFSQISRALRHRNYRLFFGGQLISVMGTFLTNTAMAWLASQLAPEPHQMALFISLVLFASQIPMFVLGPIAGVWIDRLNRRKLLILTQTLSMLQSFALAILAFTHINLIEAVGLALVQGLINSFDVPARQAFVVEMVDDRQDLSNAIALNSTMVHFARVFSPALAGLLIHAVGMGWCFLLDGISYIAVIAALAAMRIEPRPQRPQKSIYHELREGFAYVLGFQPARELLLLTAIFSLSGLPAAQVLLPIFARHFGGNAHGDLVFGFLGACSGVGALIGALALANRRTVLGLGRMIGISSTVYALAIAGFALSGHLWLSMLIIPFAGWGMITNFASANTILQTLTSDNMRGRVMSFYAMSFLGLMPLGMMMVGPLATRLSPDATLGARYTMLIAAAVCLAAALRYWTILPKIRDHVRPIYRERGILPEIAEGLAAEAVSPVER